MVTTRAGAPWSSGGSEVASTVRTTARVDDDEGNSGGDKTPDDDEVDRWSSEVVKDGAVDLPGEEVLEGKSQDPREVWYFVGSGTGGVGTTLYISVQSYERRSVNVDHRPLTIWTINEILLTTELMCLSPPSETTLPV